MKPSRKVWSDDKPWGEVDQLRWQEAEDRERAERNERGFSISFKTIREWFKRIFKS